MVFLSEPSHRHAARLRGVFAGVVTVSAALLAGCHSDAPPPAAGAGQALPVSAITVQTSNVPLASQWVGTLDGYVNAQIQPQVSGYLIRQTYTEGSSVAKGQVLFQIDPRPFQAALDQAQGQVDQAKAQLALAEINVKRDTPLAQQRAIAQAQLDNETQQAAQASAAVKTAEAAVANAKLNLGFTQVRSLISGIAGQATVQVGNLVSPQSVLTSVSQLDPIKVYFSISDNEYLSLVKRTRTSGGDLLSGAAKVPLTLTLSNGQEYPRKGKIVFVDRQMNAQTGAIRIAAAFPNPGNILRPGQFGRVTADTEVRQDAILIPQAAVQDMQGQQQVFTVGTDNKAHLVNVKIGQQIGQDVLVESGLTAGTKIIVDNLQKLRDGAPVAPHAPQPSPNLAPEKAGQ